MTQPEWMQLRSIALHDGTEAPQLWPDGASPEYVAARTGRGIDLLSPARNVLDLLPGGRGEWMPDNTYPGATRGEPAA